MSDGTSLNWGGYLLNLSTISYWIDKAGCWFVDILVPIYLLTPFWNRLLEKVAYPVVPTAIVFIVMMSVDNFYASAFHQASFFFIGFWLGRYVRQGVSISLKVLVAFGGFFALLLVGYYVLGIGELLPIIVMPCVFIGCLVLERIGSSSFVSFLNFFGAISLESYLLNVTLITYIVHFNLLPEPLFPYRYLFIVVVGIMLATVIHRLCKPIVGK